MLTEFFDEAFRQAQQAIEQKSGGPFGAVVVHRNKIVGRGFNTVLRDNDPTAHAEINAIRQAGDKLKTPHLTECFLVTVSEPCPMCLMAAHWARLQKIYYAAPCSLAGRYGFQDEKLYRSVEKSEMEVVEVGEFRSRAEELFEEWQRQGGQLY